MKGLVIVANRLPVEIDGTGTMTTSPGGLSSALSSVTEPGTQWVGWAGPAAGSPRPFERDGLLLHPVTLSPTEVERYYAGFANSVLWPLFHGRLRTVELDRAWWRSYRAVNERFAAAVADIAPLGATVWVHDYHLLLLPALLRARRPDVRIGFFLHIPFPSAQLFAILPWRREVIAGMLGADLLGFQVAEDAANFTAAAERVIGARATGRALFDRLRSAVVDVFPISVDFERWDAAGERARPAAARQREALADGHVFLGVDRLDYTKGIVNRLQAFAELLDEGALPASTATFVQVAVPSRGDVAAYREERAELEAIVADVNDRHRRADGTPPVLHIDGSLDEAGLAAWFRAADTLVVTSLADGMNLVAKEFVSCRGDLAGTLVLSEFAGAAQDLDAAIIVNPYDIEALKRAFVAATAMTPEVCAANMAAMRAAVRENDVHRWAGLFLARLESLSRHHVGEATHRPVRSIVAAAIARRS